MPFPMPRHATKTSFVKGDPRVSKKRSPESVAKQRATQLREIGGRLAFFCDWCGTKSEMTLYKFEHQKHHFCNIVCYNKWQSAAMKEKIICRNSKTFSPEARRLARESLRKIWEKKKEEEKTAWIRKMRASLPRGGKGGKQSAPEKQLQALISKHSLEYRYTGDGKFWIDSFNPDFVNCNGKKVLIEVHGDYWHKRPEAIMRDSRRSKIFASYGWREVVIWASELNALTEAQIIARIQEAE